MNDTPKHPGTLLAMALHASALSQASTARLVGISAKHLNQIIHGHANISADIAVRLEPITGVDAEVLLIAQVLHQAHCSRTKQR